MTDRPPALVLEDRLGGGLVKPEDTERQCTLVYGAPGVGKTVLMASAQDDPRMCPVLVLSAEGGHKSIMWRLQLPETDPRSGQLIIKRVEEFPGDFVSVVDLVEANPGLIKTVVIDSLTDLAWRVEQNMLAKPNKERKTEGALGWSEWRIFNTQVRYLVTLFRNLNIHVLATALETEREGRFGPTVGGKTTAELMPALFDSVYRLAIVSEPQTSEDGKTTRMVQRRMLTLTEQATVSAKDRNDPFSLLPATMYDPTFPAILERAVKGMALAAQQHAQKPAQKAKEKVSVE